MALHIPTAIRRISRSNKITNSMIMVAAQGTWNKSGADPVGTAETARTVVTTTITAIGVTEITALAAITITITVTTVVVGRKVGSLDLAARVAGADLAGNLGDIATPKHASRSY